MSPSEGSELSKTTVTVLVGILVKTTSKLCPKAPVCASVSDVIVAVGRENTKPASRQTSSVLQIAGD